MYYIFVNPASHSGKGKNSWKQVKKLLLQHNAAYELHYTKPGASLRPELEIILQKESQRPIPLIILGGDGTLNQCINSIPDFTSFEISVIPNGSGNDFTRGRLSGLSLEDIVSNILSKKHTDSIDIGTVSFLRSNGEQQTRNFAVSTGFGYDANICYDVDHSSLKNVLNRLGLGKLTYILFGVKNLFSTKIADLELSIDGQPLTFPNVFFFVAMNCPKEGGGICMAPPAVDNDGKLCFCVYHGLNRLQAFFMLVSILFQKQMGRRGAVLLEGTHASIRSTAPRTLHYDGETVTGCTEFEITLEKKLHLVY